MCLVIYSLLTKFPISFALQLEASLFHVWYSNRMNLWHNKIDYGEIVFYKYVHCNVIGMKKKHQVSLISLVKMKIE